MDDKVGSVNFNIESHKLLQGQTHEGWFPLDGDARNGEIYLTLAFRVAGSEIDVPNCYFDVRENSKCTLYQDAHHDDGDLPTLVKANGEEYEHGKCWSDLYTTVQEAEHFIYITGWAVWINTVLCRGEGDDSTSLGQLLRQKAAQGVKICLLVWNEKTTLQKGEFVLNGMMGTHDEDTRVFFEEEFEGYKNVKCKLATRYASQGALTQFVFTHHQKSVICDSPCAEYPDRKRTVAFMGGIDLCDGRYDTPKHPIYRTLQSIHKDDYHQVWPGITQEHGPRQPWHDIHSKVEGPAALMVKTNFVDRWHEQGSKYLAFLKVWRDDDGPMLSEEEEGTLYAEDPERWSAQLFRSIDGSSARFPNLSFAEQLQEQLQEIGKHHVENSIHTAMVHHIRRAERFIYIENQYFIGSAPHWNEQQNSGAINQVPAELAIKICQKIAAGERFAVYILIPLFCEGWPEEAAPNEIMFYQFLTFEFMYKWIGEAIQRAGSDAHPKDYLNVFCLGCRETEEGSDHTADLRSCPPASLQAKINASRRYMAYVHSKMMIVDDEYVMVGSANINERSLAGDRDTELCMGMYQPNYRREENNELPKGDVACFRKALWCEHASSVADESDVLDQPDSMECVKMMRKRADENWAKYSGDEVVDMEEHLMTYPFNVARNGKIAIIPGQEDFPDTNARVHGKCSGTMPDILTT
ncbi:hypothetical protein SARC_05021 [Sphaeroforma arctica JP610]|uniref:phospholipase D n=1 Tax=Sphaeroforma arctica JP610 TaxID=667725 RepID=A0A0L0G3D5_9EUKA|nr:hypothetical protein SARC_05021 [Sphaeroforma arctica JP610]KNC82703.1 hypothetical protein SARC_05021 [Sphaeroforma arctica JP610]|eukprot:XP_014156605.1 hypothetical protein SARC_05021 [Sphaeroforma arctica JP610]